MRNHPRFTLGLAVSLLALALPAAASAQTQYARTWVSSTGDDASSTCSRLAPCKTLRGAFSKTATRGYIGAVDAAGYGGAVITRSVTVDFSATDGGILAEGITVNAGPEARVKIRGVNMNGFDVVDNGIRIISARSVKISDVEIFNFTRNGVTVENSNPVARVVVKDSEIHDNTGTGVLVAPASVRAARVTLRRNDIDDNGCGVAATRFGAARPPEDLSFRCGTAGAGDGAIAIVNAFGNSISDSTRQGFVANGSSATVRLARNEVTGSATQPALVSFNTGDILSYGNNFVSGNPAGNGAPTGNAEPQL